MPTRLRVDIFNSYDDKDMFMRVINANYAKYFNKKYKRSGHLWQDRYKSKYITLVMKNFSIKTI